MNEYFAKVVLESCFPQKFDILEISDKPDLRHFVSGTGIEVTYSMPKKEAEAVNVWHRLYNGKSKNCEKDIERLSQLGIEYDSKSFVWDQGCYDGNIKEGPIKEFFDAVAQKVERLNSKNAEYANMAHYELFVNSTILIPNEQIMAVIGIYKGYQGYLKSHRNNFLAQKIIKNYDEDTYLYVKGNYEPIISEEQWDRCKEIREQKKRHCHYLTQNGEVRKESGIYSSKDIWSKKLRCRCGYRMRRNKWHKNKSGEIIYGYKCYNQLNNGTKTVREQAGVDSSGACDLRKVCDWKFEMMARHIFSGLWGSRKDILGEVSSLYRVNAREEKIENDKRKGELDQQIAAIDAKMRRLTQMRIDDELSKSEYLEFKSDLEKKKEELVRQRSTLDSKAETDPDCLTERIQDFLLEKMDFTAHCIDRDVISKFVDTIIPRTETCFEWYMNFNLVEKANDEKKMVWEFSIDFQEAKSYRTEVNALLRPTQWQDLLVRVYM